MDRILAQLEELEDSQISSSLPRYLKSVFSQCHDSTQRTRFSGSGNLPINKSLHDQEEMLFSPLLFDSPQSMCHNSTSVEHHGCFLSFCDTAINVTETNNCAHTQPVSMDAIFPVTSFARSTGRLECQLKPGLSGSTSTPPIFDVAVKSTTTKTTATQQVTIPISAPLLQHSTSSEIASSGCQTHFTDTAHRSNVTVSHQILRTSDTTFTDAHQPCSGISTCNIVGTDIKGTSTTSGSLPSISTSAGTSCCCFAVSISNCEEKWACSVSVAVFSLFPPLSFFDILGTTQR